jgi:hypothetical protein
MSSFHVDARISVKLEVELAIRLGEMILSSGTEDKQILALGHMLCNIDKDDEENPTQSKWIPRKKTNQVSSIVSEWQDDETQSNKVSISTMREKVAQSRKYSSPDKWGFE